MSVAVLVYGEPRELHNAKKYWPTEINDKKFDYFLSLWDRGECHSPLLNYKVEYNYDHNNVSDLNISDVLVLSKDSILKSSSSNKAYMQLYILQRGIELVTKSNKFYELVIFMRPDLYFSPDAKISLSDDLNKCLEINYSSIIKDDHWCEDIFMILSRDDFNKLSNIDLCEYLTNNFNIHCPIHPLLASIFKSSNYFIPNTSKYIEVIRPNVKNLIDPNLASIKQKFFEWGKFYRFEVQK